MAYHVTKKKLAFVGKITTFKNHINEVFVKKLRKELAIAQFFPEIATHDNKSSL